MRNSLSQPAGAKSRLGTRAFTLLELMLVTLIILILAALVLPTIEKARAQAKRVACISNLKQVGLGYHAFAHDHSDKFPFQVSTRDGGTLEFLKAAGTVQGDFYFSFRHFQALSNELDATKILICPADKRTNATTFAVLHNENISYFVGVTAEYTRPDSLLAGDHNISDGAGGSSLVRLAPNSPAAWTSECHEFKGNLLFAGGQVEGVGNGGLASVISGSGLPVNTLLPPVIAPGGGYAGGGTAGGSGGTVAALQEFFQVQPGAVPAKANPSPASVPANQPANRPLPALADGNPRARAETVQNAQPPEPAFLPAPLAKASSNHAIASTNVVATASALRDSQPKIARDATEAAPNIFIFVLKPERCWPCWIAVMLLAVVSAYLLGREVLRQRRVRLRALSPLEPLTAGPSAGAKAASSPSRT